MTRKQKRNFARIIASAALLVVCAAVDKYIDLPRWALILIYALPYLTAGYDVLIKSFKGIIHGQVFDENFLMAVATIGAFVLGEYPEAASVMIFYQTGEMFQSVAVGKSRRSISELMDIRPDYANVERDGSLVQVDPNEVEIGTEIVVKPGEKIPLDGVITEGHTTLDASALTGESMPVEAGEGGAVQSGCINSTGLIKLRTTKAFGESTASKILELVENSGAKKSRSENFITKFARYYTPVVCALALALAVIAPLASMALGMSADWSKWIMRALIFLVISCPCALVISIPLSFFACIGGAGTKGVLIKGSTYIETLSKVDAVVFDKTGTVTKGVFEVAGVHHNVMEEEKLLEYAALAESSSNHPIAKSIAKILGDNADKSRVTEVEELSGQGVRAVIDGKSVAVGNDRLMEKLGIEYKPCHKAGTVLHVAVDGSYEGHILISDVVKPQAKRAVAELHECGVNQTVMLTGDNAKTAEYVAKEIGVSKAYSHLMPEDKVEKVEELLAEQKKGSALAFVGDGLNDAPVLSRADVGIAMGALGSDAAIEAADVVLMDDDPLKIPLAIRISKKCMRIVYENIGFAIGVKFAFLLLGAIGVANMWFAIFADVGVMIIAVLNAIRMLSNK